MKVALITGLIFLFGLQARTQGDENCFPKNLIVTAENLNFRRGANTSSEVIDQLENGERLSLISTERTRDQGYLTNYWNYWIKVERESTDEEGYVYGEYVKPQEIAYLNGFHAEEVQPGNWYGIYEEDRKVKIESISPSIKKTDVANSIVSDKKHVILFCSQNRIREGDINGTLYPMGKEYFKIGDCQDLVSLNNLKYGLVCTGEVSYSSGWMRRSNEKIILTIQEINGTTSNYREQDLSDCLLQVGEEGYKIQFAGDLNKDGLPELVISEATYGAIWAYYFRSNKGKLVLQSVTSVSN